MIRNRHILILLLVLTIRAVGSSSCSNKAAEREVVQDRICKNEGQEKMKTYRILTIVFLLLAASAAFGQPSRAKNTDANQSWPIFWRQITAAINRKDHVALRKMMPDRNPLPKEP